MEQHTVKVRSIDKVTPNVLKIVTEKPQRHTFTPGQATEVSINKTFYVCGPPPMMDAIEKQLANLHVDEKSIVKEAF